MTELDPHVAAALGERYPLVRRLGEGGSATVYLARDPKHDRQVAIKVLRPELAALLGDERFVQEIRTTANLQHPNILPLYDSGVADAGDGRFLFYVMPYVEGETLRERLRREGRLGLADLLRIADDIARALDYAHERGVVHRDIKPENILLQHGQAVVADFGIALALSESAEGRLTATGLAIGSPAYMSPEQVAGDRRIDERCDVYGLGCVVYEMLTGAPPFQGPTARSVMARQVTDVPPPVGTVRPDAPSHVVVAVARALSKAPADRHPTAGALARALATPPPGGTPAAADEKPSIVVLPFANLSPDADTDFIADGFTEEIISDLSAIGSLRVISRTSAMRLKGASDDAAAIAARLGVRYVLEGSVRRSGGALRVIARLVDARADAQIWTDRCTGEADDVFDIQERVARSVVGALRVRLSPREDRALGARELSDPRAYESYLRARAAIWNFSLRSLDTAILHLERALDLVGDNELLLATLGNALVFHHTAGAPADFARAQRCVDRIFALDPDSPYGLSLRGMIQFHRGELRRARPDLERAHRMSPDDPDVLLMLGYLCSLSGEVPRAETLFARLNDVDPLTPLSQTMPGFIAWLDGRFEEALPLYRRFADLEPDNPMALWSHTLLLLITGRVADAAAALQRLERAAPDSPYTEIARAQVLATQGHRERAAAAITPATAELAATHELFSRELTHCYALAGRVDDAVRWFDNTVRIGTINFPFWAHHDRMLDPIRHDARFQRRLCDVWDEWSPQARPEALARYPRPGAPDGSETGED